MRLTPQQVARVHQLRNEGYTIREVADEMGVAKFHVEQAIKQPVTVTPPMPPVPATYAYPVPAAQQELVEQRNHVADEARRITDWQQQLLRQSTPYAITSQTHIQEMEALTKQSAELAELRADLERREAALKDQLQATPDQQTQYEQFRRRAREEKFIKRYNRLIQQLLDHCDDVRWTGDEVDDFLQLAETVKANVQQYCDANAIDERRLLIYTGVSFIIDEVSEMQDDQTSGFFASSSVDFDFSEGYQDKLKALMVERFEQSAPGDGSAVLPATHTNDDDDEFDDD